MILGVAALIGGAASLGWAAMAAVVAAMCVMGATAGLAWVEDQQSWRRIATVAAWFGIGAVLVLGLPPILGPWSLSALAGVPALCPPLVGWMLVHARRSRPVCTERQARSLSGRDLDRRWLQSSEELRRAAGDTRVALTLVEERAMLLDEIERRDPVGFEALLVRAGWRDPDDRTDGRR